MCGAAAASALHSDTKQGKGQGLMGEAVSQKHGREDFLEQWHLNGVKESVI